MDKLIFDSVLKMLEEGANVSFVRVNRSPVLATYLVRFRFPNRFYVFKRKPAIDLKYSVNVDGSELAEYRIGVTVNDTDISLTGNEAKRMILCLEEIRAVIDKSTEQILNSRLKDKKDNIRKYLNKYLGDYSN